MDENKEEMSLNTSAVSGSAGWREPQFMCDRQCSDGFKNLFFATVMVEENVELYTINLCEVAATWGKTRGKGERQAVGTPCCYEEIAPQASGSWRTRLRAQDHVDLRGEEDLREETVESRGCVEFGPRVSGHTKAHVVSSHFMMSDERQAPQGLLCQAQVRMRCEEFEYERRSGRTAHSRGCCAAATLLHIFR